ncbi:MAG: hypothetical protein Q7S85_10270 [Rugosibacter sp.]|nr:hypothetical protein [Rugosibacter sp.]
MEVEATAGLCPTPKPPPLRLIGKSLAEYALYAVVIAIALLAWHVRHDSPYTPASDFGYWLGVAGGSLMLVLLIYPLRKRFRTLAVLGPLRHWFRFHLVAGIAGPLIILFHSTFRVGSFNAAIALASMLLVVASGLVGRFLYRKIHHGLYGSRATAAELQRMLEQQVESLRETLAQLPAVEQEIRHFTELVSVQPHGFWRRSIHFALLGLRRTLASRRVQRAIAGYDMQTGNSASENHKRLRALAGTLAETLSAAQRTAQFSTYERLFSLWHVVHIPFLCMLVVTAVIHVVAVHAY